jgi:arsenate reductase
MAEGLAKQLLGKEAYVESAGISPSLGRASENAVKVMNEFGIDISDHFSKSVESVPLDMFDYIVALDPDVADCLIKNYEVDSGKLIEWDIKDPIGQGVGFYRQCALEIKARLESFLSTFEKFNSKSN